MEQNNFCQCKDAICKGCGLPIATPFFVSGFTIVDNMLPIFGQMCSCDPPVKKYSDAGCYQCWTCETCGNYGGCDNRFWENLPWGT